MMEKIIETKICKQCGTSFTITDKDMEFYDKISPKFGGKKYQIPAPRLCPDCRSQRRLTWRNERKLYRRTCDATGKQIISIYAPDKSYRVYDQKIRWSDQWDPMLCAQEYDDKKTFFQQFDELMKKVPYPATFTSNSENSDYANHIGDMKNCYLVSASRSCEDVLYSSKTFNSKQSLDLLDCTYCNHSYELYNCENCYACNYSINAQDCKNSSLLWDCKNCDHCFLCYNLINKSYCIENKQYTKEEYKQKIKGYTLDRKAFDKVKKHIIHKAQLIIESENCSGDKISNSKNCHYCFNTTKSENCKYLENGGEGCNDTYDGFGYGYGQQLGYEFVDTGVNSYANLFTIICHRDTNAYYSYNCYDSSNIFGCIGLRKKEYCIFNKQYTKEEYELLVPKIIEKMIVDRERGEFFPASISPFGYNETVAQEYFPLDKGDALKTGYKWMEQEYPINIPENAKTIKAQDLPKDITEVKDDILNQVIICESTGKLFRIIKSELEFYRKHNLPIPHKHPDIRHIERMQLRNPRKLRNRKCSKCGTDIQTSYVPERPEIVYCEDCYNKEIYG